MPTQAERLAHTRRLLLDATIRCIAEQGYRATTTRRVASSAGVSLGALAHHFPSRLELVAAALDDASRAGTEALRADVAGTAGDTDALLDALWRFFCGELFTVWVKGWLAAAEDEGLYARMVPIEARVNRALADVLLGLAPPDLGPEAFRPRLAVALHAMRGLALGLAVEPRASGSGGDPWPATRAELSALIRRRP
ncbi:MAG TPA: TetR/AcrR family transcriptional regulator [Solirubrobacteraceae bacterium]|jgi:AcrR family transcriptional regulator|nr:TetR/AcrR family transcriptional regulator [Solirubrobacteraceae bacterium]